MFGAILVWTASINYYDQQVWRRQVDKFRASLHYVDRSTYTFTLFAFCVDTFVLTYRVIGPSK